MNSVVTVESQGIVLAIILRGDHYKDGIEFFTPGEFSQQLGYMSRPKGYVIEPHLHLPVKREILYTKEVLFIKSGKVHIDFYDDDKIYVSSEVASKGDVVLLARGGHGFAIL